MFQKNELLYWHCKEDNRVLYVIFLKEGESTWSFIKTASGSFYVKTSELKSTGYALHEKSNN